MGRFVEISVSCACGTSVEQFFSIANNLLFLDLLGSFPIAGGIAYTTVENNDGRGRRRLLRYTTTFKHWLFTNYFILWASMGWE